jgi:AcrR family transcriptional regulator
MPSMETGRPAATGGTDGTGTRPQRLPAARRRRQLVVAAIELFGAQGFHDTSMDDIADEAGVTKPVLYQHFPSKRDLYVELLESVGTDLIAAVSRAAEQEIIPSRRVLAGFTAYFRFVSEKTAAFQLLFGTGARGTDEFADVIRRFEDQLAGIIAGLIDAGTDDDHRNLLAYAMAGSAEMISRQWVLSARDHESEADRVPQLDPEAGDILAQRLSELLWGGLRSLPRGPHPG